MLRIGQRDGRVERADSRVAPFSDSSREDVGNYLRRDLERRTETGNIVGDDDSTEDGRDVKDRTALRFRHFCIRHRAV